MDKREEGMGNDRLPQANTPQDGECVPQANTPQDGECLLQPVERRNTACLKWDALETRFGDPDLIAMWVADMDFAAPRPVIDALHARVEQGAFGYQMQALGWKDAFIQWERERHGWLVDPEWIKYVPGVVPAIYWLIHAYTAPGDACLIQTPVYYPFSYAVRDTGRRLVESELVAVDGVYGINMDALEKTIVDHAVKLFILCSPHNPVGRVWSHGELEAVWGVCQRHGVVLVSDEIHHDIVTGCRKHVPTGLLAGAAPDFIMLTSASKTFNLASLENALLVIPEAETRKRYDAFARSFHPSGGNLLGYVAVEAAYRQGAAWLEALLAEIRANEAHLRQLFARELPEVIMSPLEGTYLLWMDLRALVSADELETFMNRECGVAVDFGFWFGACGSGHIRVNLATPRWRVEDVGRRMVAAGVRRRNGGWMKEGSVT